MTIPYRTQRALKRLLVVILIVAVIFAAVWGCWLLWVQRYIIYTAEGGAKLDFDLPPMAEGQLAVPPEEVDIPIFSGLIPIGTVLALELALALLSLRSMWVRKLLCGKPVILIDNGRILQENLKRTRVTLDELTGHLREKDVLDIASVQFAILETNGNLSVFPYPKERPASAKEAGVKAGKQYIPVTIISDGRLLKENLKIAGKDLRWVQRVLEEKKASVKSTWLLTVDAGDKIRFYPKEEK